MKALVAGDFHIPFHNDKILLKFLKSCEDADLIVLAGDFMDFYGISRFDASPNRADDLEFELSHGRMVLGKIRSHNSEAQIIFQPGNHEERLQKFLSRGKNRALYNLSCLTLPELLNFKKYDVTLHEDKVYHLNESFIIIHGSRCGLHPAKGEAMSHLKSGLSFHCHKHDSFIQKFLDISLKWYSVPCMCDIESQGYARDFRHSWVTGWAEVEYDDKSARVQVVEI